jgi:hypothetical protein
MVHIRDMDTAEGGLSAVKRLCEQRLLQRWLNHPAACAAKVAHW